MALGISPTRSEDPRENDVLSDWGSASDDEGPSMAACSRLHDRLVACTSKLLALWGDGAPEGLADELEGALQRFGAQGWSNILHSVVANIVVLRGGHHVAPLPVDTVLSAGGPTYAPYVADSIDSVRHARPLALPGASCLSSCRLRFPGMTARKATWFS